MESRTSTIHPQTNNGIQLSRVVDAVSNSEASHNEARPIPRSQMPVGAIGWTQDSISRRIYNVTLRQQVEIQGVVNAARNDPRGALTFMREHFPDPIRVYDAGEDGTLSVDNRRLAVYHMVVPSDAQIPVRVLTRDQADRALRRDNPTGGIHQRYTTINGGYSIVIRGDRTSVSQGVCYIPSPFVVCSSNTLSWICSADFNPGIAT